ncbi:hypothetical protein ACJX0J_038358, partial [Zea mays]
MASAGVAPSGYKNSSSNPPSLPPKGCLLPWSPEAYLKGHEAELATFRVYPIPAMLYLVKNLLQYYIFEYVYAPSYHILKNLNIISTGRFCFLQTPVETDLIGLLLTT